MYCFLKADGTIKKHYKEACLYILTAENQKHEIYKGRSDTIINSYECYTTKHTTFLQPKRDNIICKVQEICSDFNCDSKVWYSWKDISIELYGTQVPEMLNEISKYLQ